MTGEDRQAEPAPAQATPATPEPCPATDAGETGTAATDHRGEDAGTAGTAKPGTVEPGTMPPEVLKGAEAMIEESQAAPLALPEITGTPGTSCPALDASAIAAAATAGKSIDAATGKLAPPETFSICPAEIAEAAKPADAPAGDEPAAALDEITGESLPLPNTPIKRRTLQAVVIPAPPGPTLARYIMSDGEKFAYFQDLSQEEKNIVLEFLLRYAPPLIARKPKRRTSPEDATPPELPELDAAPLEKILEDAEKAEKELENHGKA